MSALHYAVRSSNKENVKILLNMGADPYLINNIGFSALHFVAQSIYVVGGESVYSLTKVGADPN